MSLLLLFRPSSGGAPDPTPTYAGLWEEQPGQELDQTQRWFAPDLPTEGLPPRVNAPSGLDLGYDAQQDLDLTTRWFAPEASAEGFPPQVNAYAGADIGWDAQHDRDQAQRWFAPDWPMEGFPPRPNAWAGAELAESPQAWRDGTPWHQPEDDTLPPQQVAADVWTVAKGAAHWNEQPQDWRDGTAWFAPEASVEGDIPRASAPTSVDIYAAFTGYDAQQDRDQTQRWYQEPDDTLARALASAWTGSEIGWDAQQDRSTQQTWFAPDAAVEVLVVPSVATVAQQAALWPDASGQQDRGIGPVWFAPEPYMDLNGVAFLPAGTTGGHGTRGRGGLGVATGTGAAYGAATGSDAGLGQATGTGSATGMATSRRHGGGRATR